jgi:nitrate/nitrite transporter NarK
MLNLGFPFAKSELFTLTAIAGFCGATLRIPSTFFIRIAGGRNTIFFTTALLMIPAVGAGFALQDKNTPLWTFQLLALLSGFGGGNFASSMTFGSFIGYSAAFPLAIKVVFGFQHLEVGGVMTHDTLNPNGPSALMFAWMGPFIGALIRPIGGWVSDKIGGAKVTQIITIMMILSALGVAYFMQAAYHSATPEDYFVPFFLLFLVLFAGTGIGNGSTFRTIAMIFPKEQAGPALGWTSAVAAYGAFIIPQVFGEQIKAATPQYALYGFAIFYFVCLVLNFWYYLGPKREFDNP